MSTATQDVREVFPRLVCSTRRTSCVSDRSWLAARYGRLGADWRDDLRAGFSECFRVLRPEGTLIFKWNEAQVPLRDVLALAPQPPLFGHRSGRRSMTHWLAFFKESD